MRNQYILIFLISVLAFGIGRWSNKKQPFSTRYSSCRICLDSCGFQSKRFVRTDSSIAVDFLDTMTSVVTKNNRKSSIAIHSKPLLLHLDTIFDGEIRQYTDYLPAQRRRGYHSYVKVKDKIKMSFVIYDPVDRYNTLEVVKLDNGYIGNMRRTILDGIILQDLNTGMVDSIRILVDTTEYVLKPSQ